jgi:hypothetical protein
MKTNDLFKINRQARRLNEGLEKLFGKKINLEDFDLHQLQDARNKLRTQISQVRGQSEFNENLENDAYHEAQFMLDALNAEISEREDFFVDAGTAELDEGTAMRLVARGGEGSNTYKIYKDTEWNEYVVKFYVNGEHQSEADYHTDDKDDAVGTAEKFIKEDASQVDEKAPPGAKAERMVKHIKKGYAKDGKLSDRERGIAYATAWKHHNKEKNESTDLGEDMKKLTESELNQASTIVTAKTMADRVGRWIEELSGMENDTLLTLGDSIRDEMGQEQSKMFISSVAPAIQSALDNLKQARETIANSVRALTGEIQPAEMLGAETPDQDTDMAAPAAPDAMNAGDDLDDLTAPADDFAAADAATGGAEAAGREQRESIQFQNRLMRVLAG